MKYGYDGINSSDLIGNYEILNDKIIIKYLDGSSSEIKYTKQDEIKLLNKMFNQAIARSNSYALYFAKSKKRDAIFNEVLSFCALGLVNVPVNSNLMIEYIIPLIYNICFPIFAIHNYLKYSDVKDEVNELKKYDIYLHLRHTLLLLKNNPNAFNGIEKKGELNINTLDNYSLRDMKKIRNNLTNIELELNKNAKKSFVKKKKK